MTGVILNRSEPSSKLVLAVDDAPENLSLVQLAVKSAGCTFLGAKSGVECLALLERIVPQVILLDIEMPPPNGFETCGKIRSMHTLASVPIVFLTARKSADDVKTGLAVGGNDFIVKPYDVAKLIERITYWTNRRISAVGTGAQDRTTIL
jgi:two-component system OmpR family response regulator